MQQTVKSKNNAKKKAHPIVYSDNKAFLFIPFCCLGEESHQQLFERYVKSLNKSNLWARKKVHINYLLKYITEKFDNDPDSDNRRVIWKDEELADVEKRAYAEVFADEDELDFESSQCFRFILNIEEFEKTSCAEFFKYYQAFKMQYQLESGTSDFMFTTAELFCFNTAVNILQSGWSLKIILR